jgi:hypothetical protein
MRSPKRRGLQLKHRDVDYTIVQGVGRHIWKWSVSVRGIIVRGLTATKSDAVSEAERTIDRALAPKSLSLPPIIEII